MRGGGKNLGGKKIPGLYCQKKDAVDPAKGGKKGRDRKNEPLGPGFLNLGDQGGPIHQGGAQKNSFQHTASRPIPKRKKKPHKGKKREVWTSKVIVTHEMAIERIASALSPFERGREGKPRCAWGLLPSARELTRLSRGESELDETPPEGGR